MIKTIKNIKSIPRRKIIPIGGGLLRLGETIPIDKFIIQESGKKHPNVLFLPTASKDLPVYSTTFRHLYKKLGCQVKILRLFNKREPTKIELKKLITTTDIIYVGGGDYDILLSIWNKYKIVPFIQIAYQRGAILTGLSAGCAIWYEYLIDVDNGKGKKPYLKQGLGILKGAVIPHYKIENSFPSEIRKKKILVTAIQDKCALLYTNEKLCGSVSVTDERAFTIRFPYVKKRQINLYFNKYN